MLILAQKSDVWPKINYGLRNHRCIYWNLSGARDFNVAGVMLILYLISLRWWCIKRLAVDRHVCVKQVNYISRYAASLTRRHVRPAKTQISLRMGAVWSESSQSTLWVAEDPKRLHAEREDSDLTARMRRLIWVFAERKCHLIGNSVARLIFGTLISLNGKAF